MSIARKNTTFVFESGYLKTRRWGGKMLKSIESSVWCVGWTWFDVRCIPLILGYVLHTHNMSCRPIENFLEASELQKIMKNSIFYNTFGTYKLPLEWVSNYKNHHPFAFSSKKLFVCMLSVQNCFQCILEIKENMLHTHNITWYAIEVVLMRFEINFEKS